MSLHTPKTLESAIYMAHLYAEDTKREWVVTSDLGFYADYDVEMNPHLIDTIIYSTDDRA